MTRWFLLSLASLTLAGCVSYPSYRSYDDGYYRSDSGYYDEPTYVGGSTYYSPSNYGDGDYYYSDSSYGYGYSNYSDYPYYYSLFYPLRRWSVDPYWHPGFYYGVTYYPRSYFSVGFGNFGRGYGYGYGSFYRPFGYSYLAYSPYRNSWVDNYYDWSRPYHRNSDRYRSHYAPRYGNARNEAAYLSRQSRYLDSNAGIRNYRRDGRDNSGLPNTRSGRYEDRTRATAIDRREAARGADYGRSSRSSARGADYGRSTSGRTDPGVSGFGYENDGRSVRSTRSRAAASDARTAVRSSRDSSLRSAPSQREAGQYRGDSGDIRRSTSSSRQADRNAAASRSAARSSRGYSSDVGDRNSNRSRAASTRGATEGYALPRTGSTRSYSQPEPTIRSPSRYRNESRESVDRGYAPRESRQAPSRSTDSRSYAPRGSVEAPASSYQPRESSSRQAPQRSYSAPTRRAEPAASRGYTQPSRSEPQTQRSAPRTERSRSSRSSSRGESRSRSRSRDSDDEN